MSYFNGVKDYALPVVVFRINQQQKVCRREDVQKNTDALGGDQ